MVDKPPVLDPFECGPLRMQQHVGLRNVQEVIAYKDRQIHALADALREAEPLIVHEGYHGFDSKRPSPDTCVGCAWIAKRDAALAGQPTTQEGEG